MELMDLLHNTDNHFGELLLNESNFLLFCETEGDFFETGNSDYLNEVQRLQLELQRELDELRDDRFKASINAEAKATKEKLQEQNDLYQKVVEQLRIRGFKDFGLEGSMRLQVHELENNPDAAISTSDILMLRRHEKDFLMRKNVHYQKAHLTRVNRIMNDLEKDPVKNAYDMKLLATYSAEFQKLCEVINALGSFESHGLLHAYKLSSNEVDLKLEELTNTSEKNQKEHQALLQILFYITMILAVVLGVVFSFVFARRRARPLLSLLGKIEQVPEKGIGALNGHISQSSTELVELYKAFKKVFKQLQDQLAISRESSQKLEIRNKELQQVNRELDQFVYSISHDLRAPLTSVMGLVELSKHETQTDKLEQYLEMMAQSLQKLDRFIHDILDFSRNSRMKLEIEHIDFRKIINDIFKGLDFSHGTVVIDKRLEIDQGCEVYSDRRRITVVLNNLISNAVKYADLNKEQPYVSVQISCDDNAFKIVVSDNGQGIADRFKEKVFNMFFRASQNSKGSGLGLYIVKETITMLSGSVVLNSIEGLGTTFTVEVPNKVPNPKRTLVLEAQ